MNQEILGVIRDKEFAQKVQELKGYPIFEGLSKDCLKSLVYNKKDCSYSMNEVIFDFDIPVSKLVLIKNGQILVTVKQEKYNFCKEERPSQGVENCKHPLQRSTTGAKIVESAIVIGPSSLGEEFLTAPGNSYYRAFVKSPTCETVEFSLSDLAKCLNISAADVSYFHSISMAKMGHFRRHQVHLNIEHEHPPGSLEFELPKVDRPKSSQNEEPGYVSQRQGKISLAANLLLK